MNKILLILIIGFISFGATVRTGGGNYSNGQAQTATGWQKVGTNVILKTSTDNVGIGTTIPAARLHLGGTSTNAVQLVVENDSATQVTENAYPYTSFAQMGSSGFGITGWANAGVFEGGAIGGLVFDSYGSNGGPIAFQANRVEKMRMTPAGNLGIGTTVLPVQLAIRGAGQFTPALLDSGAMGATILLNETTNQVNSGGALLIGGASTQKWFAGIKGLLTDGTNNSAGDLEFALRNGSAATALTERVRIRSTGNVGIGTLTPVSLLAVAGNATIGSGYSANSASSNGLLVQGNVGFGTTIAQFKLHVAGDSTSATGQVTITGSTDVNKQMFFGVDTNENYSFVSSIWQGNSFRPLVLNKGGGNVGVGTSSPASLLSISGGGSFGSSYVNTIAPTDGLIVQGNVGINSTNPGVQLDVSGSIRMVGTGAGAFRIQSALNQACTTTCTTGKALMGFDQGTLGAVLPSIVGPSDATADQCLCGG